MSDEHPIGDYHDLRACLEHLFAVGDETIDAGHEVLPAAVWLRSDGTLGKAPLLLHGHLDAHCDKQLLRQQLIDIKNGMPPHLPKGVAEGYEVVIGFVPGSGGRGVLDFDVKNGKAGAAVYDALRAEHGEFAFSAWQSPSGGGNVLFRKPPGATYSNVSPWTDDGVDVRVDGGWVVAPRNRCSWGEWKWVGESSYDTAQVLPEGIAALLKEAGEYEPKATVAETLAFIEGSPEGSSVAAAERFKEKLAVFAAATEGARHEGLKHIVCWVGGMVALDLRWAWDEIGRVWFDLMAVTGEERRDEPPEMWRWMVKQEQKKRAAAVNAAAFAAGTECRNLPDEFWEARAELAAIRRWAHTRRRSADAVYGTTRALLNVLTPPRLMIDTGIATAVNMNSLVAIIGNSGAGKTTAIKIGRGLVPLPPHIYVGELGSGEGIAEAYFDEVPNLTGKGVKKIRKRDAALMTLAEGDALVQMAKRKGSTIMSVLRRCYSGEDPGQSNATKTTWRSLDPDSYRCVLLAGLQVDAAAAVLTDSNAGTPQRFVFFNANDPSIPARVPNAAPPWTGPPWVPATINPPFAQPPMQVAAAILAEIQELDLAVQQGAVLLDELDSHRNQNRAVEAAHLALFAGRQDINDEDWQLGGVVMDTSDAVRRWVMERSAETRQKIEEGRTQSNARRHVLAAQAVADDAHERAVIGGAKAIARRAHKCKPEKLTTRDMTQATAGSHRQEAGIDEMAERAEAMHWVRLVDGGCVAGESAPA
jgi:hypothetical protein